MPCTGEVVPSPISVPGRKLELDVDGLFHDPGSFSFTFGIMYF